MENIIEQASKAAGGQAELARQIGVSPQAVNKWTKRGRVPAERVLSIETVTGIARHLLRPDLYPQPETNNAAA